MSTETLHNEPPAADRFEGRLLATILDDFDALSGQSGAPRAARQPRRARFALGRLTVSALGASVAVAVVVAASLNGGDTAANGGIGKIVGAGSPAASGGNATLIRLASASVSAPVLQGRYVVLSEADSETGQADNQRTSVIDSQTGSSVTYQQVPAGSDIPTKLTEGPDSTNTEAWFQALPTDPAALSAKLLGIAQAKQQQAEQLMKQKVSALQKQDPQAVPELRSTLAGDQPSNDQLLYNEADDLLWNPLVQPTLRSALYKVLASINGVIVDPSATDPSGRPAVAMTYSTVIGGGTAETDITYEDATTGAVLAQVWKVGSDTITSVYQPVTSTNAMPADPYGN